MQIQFFQRQLAGGITFFKILVQIQISQTLPAEGYSNKLSIKKMHSYCIPFDPQKCIKCAHVHMVACMFCISGQPEMHLLHVAKQKCIYGHLWLVAEHTGKILRGTKSLDTFFEIHRNACISFERIVYFVQHYMHYYACHVFMACHPFNIECSYHVRMCSYASLTL